MSLRAGLLSLGSALLLAQAPVLTVDRTSQDFGRISPKAPVTARFELSNTGGGNLVLRDVRPSCGCTTALPRTSILAPGERTDLEVRYDPRGERGEVHRSIRIRSNDPVRGEVDLELAAEVVPSVVLSAYSLFLGDLLPGDRVERTVTCSATTGRPLHLRSLAVDPVPFLAASAAGTGRDLAVRVTLDASKLPQDRNQGRQTLTVATDDPDTPEVTLELHWAKGTAIQAMPAKLAFPPAAAGRSPSLALRLRSTRGKPFRLLGGAASLPCFRLEGLQGPAAAEHLVSVQMAEDAEPGLHAGLLTFRTDAPDAPELTVEVMGYTVALTE